MYLTLLRFAYLLMCFFSQIVLGATVLGKRTRNNHKIRWFVVRYIIFLEREGMYFLLQPNFRVYKFYKILRLSTDIRTSEW